MYEWLAEWAAVLWNVWPAVWPMLVYAVLGLVTTVWLALKTGTDAIGLALGFFMWPLGLAVLYYGYKEKWTYEQWHNRGGGPPIGCDW